MAGMNLPVLTTSRLRIRPFAPGDLDACHAALGGDSEGTTLEERAAWLRWSSESPAQLERLRQPPYGDRAIELLATGELVGACGLVPSMGPFAQLPGLGGRAGARQRAGFGAACGPIVTGARWSPEVGLFYHVSEAHRGLGYATEAARALVAWAGRALHLARIVATTRYDNHASMRVMERLGMTLERNPLPDPPWLQVVGVYVYDGDPPQDDSSAR
jgi:ribosomal-protein-alanine N-acetyltransferase